MISVQTAISTVLTQHSKLEKTEEKELAKALNYVLAEDLHSTIDLPNFRQSAMDGYALNKLDGQLDYVLQGEVKAGDAFNPILKEGEAVRIFTGAPVPDTANCVVMQERINREGSRISLNEPPKEHSNIRPQGEQLKKGALALAKGTRLKAPHISFLASLGIPSVKVVSKPKISIIVTGNELISPNEPLERGKIYESNAAMLQAALNGLDYNQVTTHKVEDDFQKTISSIQKALDQSDVVLVSGGISVGDYDFVGKAFEKIGVKKHFYKVKQKPGKPLFYGQYKDTAVFGLPGNPAAALSCFYIYVLPLLNCIQGIQKPELERIQLPLKQEYTPKGDRAQFLKARIDLNGVEILSGQSSSMVNSFTIANALACIEEESTTKAKGALIEVIRLP